MKFILLNLLFFVSLASISQTSSKSIFKQKFDTFPKTSCYVDSLIGKITTSQNISYWECRFNNCSKTSQVIIRTDPNKVHSEFDSIDAGIFLAYASPLPSGWFINAIDNKGENILIDSDSGLIEFMKPIDNVEEALLVARMSKFHPRGENEKFRQYLYYNKDYYLKLSETIRKPRFRKIIKEVYLVVNESGKIQVIKKKRYKSYIDKTII